MGPLPSLIRTREGRVLALALASRIAVLALMAAADVVFADLASSAQVQNFACAGGEDAPIRSSALDEMAPWDSVYFVRIAKCGYENDMTNAFFPLLPAVMRYGERLTGLFLLERWVPVESLFTLVGLAVNMAAFCAAALALHRLSMATLQDADLSNLVVILFCFNPASVFYSAVYTEALFAACSWAGLLLLPTYHWAGVAALTLAGAARSNGILACWFVLHGFTAECIRRRQLSVSLALRTAASCAVIVSPYVAMQAQAYLTYCTSTAFPAPEWCHKAVPSLYGYVQERYWEVGFLRFYTKFVRWPRVIQSLPVAFLATAACLRWASVDWRRAFTLGLLPVSPIAAIAAGKAGTGPMLGRRSPSPMSPEGVKQRRAAAFCGDAVAPYIYHLALMTAAALLVMHVNVATRFLSASPVIYWFAALYLSEDGPWRWRAAWVWMWALAFTALGCLMFPNFYPWT